MKNPRLVFACLVCCLAVAAGAAAGAPSPFAVTLGESGVQLSSRAGAAPPWRAELSIDPFVLPGVDVSYVEVDRGVEQRTSVAVPPSPDARAVDIVATLRAPGVLELTASGEAQLVIAGQSVLVFDRLRAADASGRPLSAELTVEPADAAGVARLHVQVDVRRAAYPVTIDLAITGEPWAKIASSAVALERAPEEGGRLTPLVAPVNDTCASAEVVPAGSYPVFSTVTADITDATMAGDPSPPAACPLGTPSPSRAIWYRFTPVTNGIYQFSLCAGTGTASTVDDTILGVYSSSTGDCNGSLTSLACDDDACTVESFQSVVSLALTGGTPYFVVVWKWDSAPPAAGDTAIQLRVDSVVPPVNDGCAGALALQLDTPVAATNAIAADDFELAGSACFTGLTQAASTATGRDTVFTFTAPVAGDYSFRVQLTASGGNPVLYTASSCPPGSAPQTVGTCLAAANRNASSASLTAAEEVFCQSLAAGQQVYVYVDETTATSAGGAYTLEVKRCVRESAGNDTPATAQPLGAPLGCGIEGSIQPAADADFFALPAAVAGSRVFALADGVAGNSTDFDMRITTATDTLEFDDRDADLQWGSLSPSNAGTPLTGAPAFLRMSHASAAAVHEPYRLYSVVQPPLGAAVLETESNDTTATASSAASGYYRGALAGPAPSADVDVYRLYATAGELIYASLDADPLREGVAGSPIDAALALLDAAGATLATANDGCVSATLIPSPTLTGTTPTTCSEGIVWRARSSGFHFVRVAIGTVSTTATGAGDYLLSIATNCQVTDLDGDGAINQLDCAPIDPANPTPGEVATLTIGSDRQTISWSATALATTYQLLRGALGLLPVGPGGADETCSGPTAGTSTIDAAIPAAGAGFWYDVRGSNACGAGPYSTAPARVTTTCP